MANTVVWTDIPVLDLDRAISFYAGVLDQPVARQDYGAFSIGMLPGEGGATGCLYVAEEAQPSAHGPLVYLNCQGRLDAAEAAVTQFGGTVLQPKHAIGPHGFRVVFLDTEGNRLALHSS